MITPLYSKNEADSVAMTLQTRLAGLSWLMITFEEAGFPVDTARAGLV